LQALYKLNPGIENITNSMVYEAVRAGNYQIASDIVQRLVKYPNYGFNNLHAEVLNPDTNILEKFGKTSVTKKANTNKDLTPMHCACINPNEKILKQLLDVSTEVSVPDAELRRPVHYAAASITPNSLQLLVQAGANLNDIDN
jgi:ankyrin repeat protein